MEDDYALSFEPFTQSRTSSSTFTGTATTIINSITTSTWSPERSDTMVRVTVSAQIAVERYQNSEALRHGEVWLTVGTSVISERAGGGVNLPDISTLRSEVFNVICTVHLDAIVASSDWDVLRLRGTNNSANVRTVVQDIQWIVQEFKPAGENL